MAQETKTTATKTTSPKKTTATKTTATTTASSKVATPKAAAAPRKAVSAKTSQSKPTAAKANPKADATLKKQQQAVLGKTNDQKKAFASIKGLRVAPRKVRLVLDLIRGKDCKEAKAILMFTRKSASKPTSDCLKSAIANAINNVGLREDKLYVATCYAGEGVTMKRMLPRARGSADTIRKRTSHIYIEVRERA